MGAEGTRCGAGSRRQASLRAEASGTRARTGDADAGAVTTEFVLLYGVLLALVMSVIHFGLVFNGALAVADAADAVLEAVQVAGGATSSPVEVARTVVATDQLVRDLDVEVTIWRGEAMVSVSAETPRIVPGLPTVVSHQVHGPLERFIPEGRR